MDETFRQIEALAARGGRAAVATLVATRGTTPRKEGAKMWVGEDGQVLGSVTIGGCVDARVLAEAEQVLRDLAPRVVSMTLGDEDAWEIGLTCGGTVDVLVEPVRFARDAAAPADPYLLVREHVAAGGRAALVTALTDPTRRAVFLDEGGRNGSLGDVALDERARVLAISLLESGESRMATLDGAAGPLEVFVEIHEPPRSLIIFGGGSVAIPLVRLGKVLGFRATVVDGRPRFASRERFPEADEVLVGMPSEIAAAQRYTPATFVVLVAHDYKYDVPVLEAVLPSAAGYIGLLGSRRRGAAIMERLRERGVSAELLSRIHVPVGLDIGARTAPEIALSILAEALAVRAGRPGGSMRVRADSPAPDAPATPARAAP